MTQAELKEFSFKLINTLIAKQCYIKGYGKMFRVVDGKHNPEINITKAQMDVLVVNKIIQQYDLIWVLIVAANPFESFHSIKLPKQYQNEAA